MSLEQLLFFLLLLAIPLLERLMTAMRRRREASRTDPAATERIAAGKPVVPAHLRREASERSNAAPLVSAPLSDGVSGNAVSEAVVQPKPDQTLERARRTGHDLPAAAVGAAHASQATQDRTLRRVAFSGEDLRIAFVRMAILGPCRALEPPDPRR